MKRPDVSERNKSRQQREAVIKFNKSRKHSEETKKKIGKKSKEKWETKRELYQHIIYLLQSSSERRDNDKWLDSLPRGDKHKFWRGGTTLNRYRGSDWRVQRIACLERDDYKCSVCGESYTKGNLDVHHIVRYLDTQDNNVNNLITLCKKCHRRFEVQNGKDS
jgi:hypothetical protein